MQQSKQIERVQRKAMREHDDNGDMRAMREEEKAQREKQRAAMRQAKQQAYSL